MKKVPTKVTKINNRYIKDAEVMKKVRIRRRVALMRRLFLFAVLLIIVGGALGFTYTKQVLTLNEKQKEKSRKNKELTQLKKEEELLKRQISQLHDDDYLTKLARSEYYLSKKGEIIFNIPKEPKKNKESSN